MNEYIVTVAHAQWNNLFLVSADNKHDAIEKVWKQNFDKQWDTVANGNTPYHKKDLTATSCDELHKDEGRIICLS